MQQTKNIKNTLMKRQEVSYIVEASKNPSFAEMKTKVSEETKKPEEVIDVSEIQGKFGRGTFLVKAYVYDSIEGLNKAVAMRKTQKTRVAEKKAEEESKKAEVEAKKKAEDKAKAEKAAPAA
jgi:ribosomal protein S24E